MALRLFALFVLVLIAPSAFGWAGLGHRLVGDLATPHLTATARTQVQQLLAGEKEPTLAGVANWADTLRDKDPDYFKRTARWHYVNASDGGCAVQLARDCPNGDCVISAIERNVAILRDRARPLAERRDALKFVVHLVGDIHQPMHAGDRDDRGGNQFQISLRTPLAPEAYARDKYVHGVMGTNLHSVWDYYVLGEAALPPRAYLQSLQRSAWPPHGTVPATPMQWARESCELIQAWGVYPTTHTLDGSYGATMRPLAERRLQQAGYRLAVLLNSALDPAYTPPAVTP